ncbi:hypothetical protein TNCV_1588841 [Trichonephila clavipes]|uniref:Uncharacterized protein n=1 Tax=Trichonephila clavipes TaxID=2585209 RepID=A0A8X6V3G7_TRICX|nr:hypothetical protein TNCV_1588841 [Trichonephila clavipes]
MAYSHNNHSELFSKSESRQNRSCNHASLPPTKNQSGPSLQSRPTHIRPHLQYSIWDGGMLHVPFPSDDSDSDIKEGISFANVVSGKVPNQTPIKDKKEDSFRGFLSQDNNTSD